MVPRALASEEQQLVLIRTEIFAAGIIRNVLEYNESI